MVPRADCTHHMNPIIHSLNCSRMVKSILGFHSDHSVFARETSLMRLWYHSLVSARRTMFQGIHGFFQSRVKPSSAQMIPLMLAFFA